MTLGKLRSASVLIGVPCVLALPSCRLLTEPEVYPMGSHILQPPVGSSACPVGPLPAVAGIAEHKVQVLCLLLHGKLGKCIPRSCSSAIP